MNEINKQFKTQRENIGVTQQDVAILLGVSRVTYVKWEQNPDSMPIGKYELLMSEFERLKALRDHDIDTMLETNS